MLLGFGDKGVPSASMPPWSDCNITPFIVPAVILLPLNVAEVKLPDTVAALTCNVPSEVQEIAPLARKPSPSSLMAHVLEVLLMFTPFIVPAVIESPLIVAAVNLPDTVAALTVNLPFEVQDIALLAR